MSNEDYLSMSVRDFAATTADKTPTPGGGSVAGVVASLGVALEADGLVAGLSPPQPPGRPFHFIGGRG